MLYHIEGVTPSQNELLNMHWGKKSRLKDEWYYRVLGDVGKCQVEQKKFLNMHIVRVGKRLLDDDNGLAGCKYMIDAFVFYGYAKDDSRKYLRITFDQRKCVKGEKPHMEVTLTSSSISGDTL